MIIVTNQLGTIAPLVGRDAQLTGRVDLWLILPSYIAARPWLGRCRRLAKDYENRTRFAVAYIHLAMIRLMLRRLTRQTD